MGELQTTFIWMRRVCKLNVELLWLFIAEIRNSSVDGFPAVPCLNLRARKPRLVLTNYFTDTILEKLVDKHILKKCPISMEPDISLHSSRETDIDPFHEQVQ
jgi:hypothetical protein